MPTYEYACKDCGQHLEAVQKFSDDALTVCPNCQGSLRKVFSAPGISFKGSGFYKNDSRNSAKSASSSASSSSSDVTTPEKKDSKPAESTNTAAKPAETKTAPAKSSDSAS